MSLLDGEIRALDGVQRLRLTGRVSEVRGMTLVVADLPVPVGAIVSIETGPGATAAGEVVGFAHDRAIVLPLGRIGGVRPGAPVVAVRAQPTASVGPGLLGRVINGLGEPLDTGGPVGEVAPRPLDPPPLGPMDREPIRSPLRTGVRAIDLMTPMGRGQRMGIFAGPGVGKSTLLGRIARGTDADVSVIALIGERGREVRDFIEHSLGDEGRERSVVVVATGDESPLMRIRAAKLACAAAEGFRDQGLDVLLMMDSVTRFAHAQRQVGLSAGEPPATRGYTPSVFAEMALLLERAGVLDANAGGCGGSVTGMYTILVEGDDMTEPIADAARGILDGHLVLSRKLAQRGHYPAIDVLGSISRVAGEVSTDAHAAAREQIVRLMAAYAEAEELIQIGAYARGSNPETDAAIEYKRAIDAMLQQGLSERPKFEDVLSVMVKTALESGERVQALLAGSHAASQQGTGE